MNRTLVLLLLVATIQIRASQAGGVEASSAAPEFSVDVMSVLSKAGCNLGTCHGNLNGKGGLKLSLRGQNPHQDHLALVRSARGRRVNLAAPELSLFLQKAAGGVTHGGGVRFSTESESYRLLKDWIKQGGLGPSPTAAKLTQLSVEPSEAIVAAPQQEIQIRVTATFSDGTSRDVTDVACYELSNLNADVSADGVVSRGKFGETTLIVRYLREQRPVPIAFIQSRPDFVWDDPEAFNEIDHHVFAKLKRLKTNPSPLCDDSTFVRRAYLDAIGRLPTASEAQTFVSDNAAEKRSRLIDGLLDRPEFADFWAMKWADILRTEEKVLDTKGVEVFHGWIRDSIASAKPVDQFVRELVTGMGATFEQPAANYYRANRDPTTRGETTARLFLGTRLQCAKCHNHPFDRWTQDDYYQWSSLFSQIGYEVGDNKRQDELDKNEFAGEQTVMVSKTDEVRNPTTNEIASPKFLGGRTLEPDALDQRLDAMATWLTSPDNDLFVRSQTNFVWYQLMGQGIVDPIDDFRLTNPPSNPPLIQTLASEFSASGFDLRQLVGKIMKSRTYQLSSEPNATNVDDTLSYSHALVRRLPAEVILDMQSDLLDSPAEFLGHPSGIRAVQIPGVLSKRARRESPQQGDRFLKTFGKPDRILACDCERSNETTLKQVFVLIGQGINERIVSPSSRVAKLANSESTDQDVIAELYWTALSRAPSDEELSAALQMLESDKQSANGDRLTALQDITWALMNAKEFLFRK